MKVYVAGASATRIHASRDCPSIRGTTVREIEESDLPHKPGVKRCNRPACGEAFAKGSS